MLGVEREGGGVRVEEGERGGIISLVVDILGFCGRRLSLYPV